METVDFFSTTPRIRGYQGDTFPAFRVTVSGMEIAECSMRFVLECKNVPGSVALTKPCSRFTAQEETGFIVQLYSSETLGLLGAFTMYFILTESGNHEHRRLVGTLEVLPSPREVEP